MWLAALVLVGAAVGAAVWQLRPPQSAGAPVTRFTITLPEGQQFSPGPSYRHVTVAPDGCTIVYAANGQLYRRALDASEPVAIPGSNESGYAPVFSPNGSSIAYYVSNPANGMTMVRKIPAAGGPAISVATVGRIRGLAGGASTADVNLDWVGDQLTGSGAFGIWSAPASGGAVQQVQELVSLDPSKEVGAWPQLVDRGRHVLYAVRGNPNDPQSRSLAIAPIGGGERTRDFSRCEFTRPG